MKPWKTSSATNETRNARPSFRLDPQWSGYGPILPQGTARKPETGPDPAKPLVWSWRIGKGTADQGLHLRQMLSLLPAEALVVADAA